MKEYQKQFLRGRQLDVEHESSTIKEGKTREIFVSRWNIFEDAMEELLSNQHEDLSYPLEVIFAGEVAQDYGGPRREFLGTIMRELRDKLFTSDLNRICHP